MYVVFNNHGILILADSYSQGVLKAIKDAIVQPQVIVAEDLILVKFDVHTLVVFVLLIY